MSKVENIYDVSNSNEIGVLSNDDYKLHHFCSDKDNIILPATVRSKGLSIIMFTKGEAEICVNFHTIKLNAGSVFIISPNDVMELSKSRMDGIEGYFLFLPIDFVKTLSFDNNALNYSNIDLEGPRPVIQLDNDNYRLFEGYFNLLELNATINKESSVFTRNVSRSIVGAMIYQSLALFEKQRADSRENDKAQSAPIGRKHFYVRDFMELLHQDFKKHRTVGHYADKLFISAKYLSLIIKEATGRTATEWIDHFVILEAKNLLRYSGLNIQQIAYDLNFHNQSAFGKYFKHLTGVSPSDFRKG